MFAPGTRMWLVRRAGLSARGWRSLWAGSQSTAVLTHLSVQPIKDKRIKAQITENGSSYLSGL